jgi:rRNA maturation endonuclease Nob1
MTTSVPAVTEERERGGKYLALCLDCDRRFRLGPDACPNCGSTTWMPVGWTRGGLIAK